MSRTDLFVFCSFSYFETFSGLTNAFLGGEEVKHQSRCNNTQAKQPLHWPHNQCEAQGPAR